MYVLNNNPRAKSLLKTLFGKKTSVFRILIAKDRCLLYGDFPISWSFTWIFTRDRGLLNGNLQKTAVFYMEIPNFLLYENCKEGCLH